MDQGLAAVLGALVGGLIGVFSGPVAAMLERRRERRSLAAAFDGEIGAILKLIELRDPEPVLKDYISKLRAGSSPQLPLAIRDVKFEDVYAANVSRIGLLPTPLPRELVAFYTLLFNVRGDLAAIQSSSDSMEAETKIALAEDALGMWAEVATRAIPLQRSLSRVHGAA